MFWLIGVFAFIGILMVCQKKKICKVGFHDKVKLNDAGQGFNCNKYILKEMEAYPSVFNGDTYFGAIFREIYGYGYHKHGANPKIKHDYVCIKCGKCYLTTKKEKEIIKAYVYEYSEKLRKTTTRKMMAQDLYREKCK